MLRGLLASILIASASKALPFVLLRPEDPSYVGFCLFVCFAYWYSCIVGPIPVAMEREGQSLS